ncbi:MAG: hypothetical protein NTX77_00005, partial [Actinobacteria bacterium]|nr:hypothetical protein [Actinomycetota bacterium]
LASVALVGTVLYTILEWNHMNSVSRSYVFRGAGLPEDAEGDLLVDASHLTWRTLPVAAIVRSSGSIDDFTGASDLRV